MSASGTLIYQNTRWKQCLCLVASVGAVGACVARPSCWPRAPAPSVFTPRGHWARSAGMFGCHTWGCHWPLMGRGTQDGPPQRSTPPRVSVRERESLPSTVICPPEAG